MGHLTHNKNRPKYLDLRRIHLPLTGIVSILHRISGALLILALPFMIHLLQLSLRSEQGFEQARLWLDGVLASLFLVVLSWAMAHHFFAGIRYLLMDLDIGMERTHAVVMARAVLFAEAVVLVLLLGWLL